MSFASRQTSAGWIGLGCALLAGVVATFVSASAHADEAYLCENNRIVYVAVADLERMKKTDPCIAAYYGLKVVPAAKVASDVADKRPAKAQVSTTEAPSLRRLADLPKRARSQRKQLALAEQPVTAPGTDFRHVRILNPSDPSDAIFVHTR